MSNSLQPPDPTSNRRTAGLQGVLPASESRQIVPDPLGLNSLLGSAREILQLTKLPGEYAEVMLSIVQPQLLSSGLPEHHLDPRAFAALLAESPVIVSLLEKLNDSTVLLGAHRKREEFNLVGCLYAYAEVAIRSPLVAAELVKMHSGETSVDRPDIYSKLQGIYAEMASEEHSPVKRLLEGEFKDTNKMEASALVAGIIAPLVVLSQRVQAPSVELSRRDGILQRLWSLGSSVTQAKYETPKELQDLPILGQGLSEQVATFLRELSTMPTRKPPQEPVVTPTPPSPKAQTDQTAGQADLSTKQLHMPPVPNCIITEAPTPPAPVAAKPAVSSVVIQIPGIKKASSSSDAPIPAQLSAVVEKVEPQKNPVQTKTSPQPLSQPSSQPSPQPSPQPGQIPGVAKKSPGQ